MAGKKGKKVDLSGKLLFSDILVQTKMIVFNRVWYLVFYAGNVARCLQIRGGVEIPVLVPDTISEPRVRRTVSYSYPEGVEDREPYEFVGPMMYYDISPSVN